MSIDTEERSRTRFPKSHRRAWNLVVGGILAALAIGAVAVAMTSTQPSEFPGIVSNAIVGFLD